MTKMMVVVAACATVLRVGAALAVPTAQQSCDNARITAWKLYMSCADTVVAKVAKGAPYDFPTASAKCRHTYFKKWTAFQPKAKFAGSTCIGTRFTDNGTTVTDNLTMLVWEKKTDDGTVRDKDNLYTWSTGANNEDGSAFTTFLGSLNASGFAGANGWRLPTLVELQSIILDYPCKTASNCNCGSNPCIDSTFDSANTQSTYYWSSTNLINLTPIGAWDVYFGTGVPAFLAKTQLAYVRAVRGGL